MTDLLAEFEAMIAGMSPQAKAELDKVLAKELSATWLPNPGPQSDAYHSEADILLYGGAAGGGKTDLILGLALSQHQRTVVFRRAYVDLAGIEERLLEIVGSRDGWRSDKMVYRKDGRLIEMGALEKPGAEKQWQGRPHDLICFDEGAQLSAAKVAFVLGWLRSASPGQRCRAVIASNPPIGGDGEWLGQWFAPWLDPLFPNPAAPGELRWAIVKGEETIWVDGPEAVKIDGDTYTPLSRTFIPARLDDNPYLKGSGYRERLQNMPEPLRSQLLKGDFLAGREDHEWQVIPTAWVNAANERWKKAPETKRPMLALACDVALGGQDKSAIAKLHSDAWFAPILTKPGAECKEPADVAAWMLMHRRDGADLSVDGTGGWGSGVRSHLERNHEAPCASIVFSAGSNAHSADGKFGFKNLRAEMWWKLREALDPEGSDELKLPPDPRLLAELTTPRYKLSGTKIQIEEKDEVRKRVGGSTDHADAVVMAWHRRKAAVKKAPKLPKPAPAVKGGWQAR